MGNKGKYQTRKVKTEEIIRFQGKADEGAKHNLPLPFVGAMDNLPSTKIGQIDTRVGQIIDQSFDGGINTGGYGTIASFIGEGSNLWIKLLSLLSPRGVASYLPPTIPDLPPLPPVPPPPPPPAEPPLPYWPPTQPPWFPPFVLPPLPEPPDFNFDPLIYTPENIQWAVQVGYDPATTTRKVYATFRNWDDIIDDAGAETATATYTSDGIEYVEVKVNRTDPDGKGGYIEVEATVKLAADVALGLKAGYVIFSSGYEYAYVPTTIKVEADASAGSINVESVRLAYSERCAGMNDIYSTYKTFKDSGGGYAWVDGDGTSADVIPPSEWDAVKQEPSFWFTIQLQIEGWIGQTVRVSQLPDLTGQDRYDFRYAGFDELCQEVGGGVYASGADYGFRRSVSSIFSRGKFISGDDVGEHLYLDLLNLMNYIIATDAWVDHSDFGEDIEWIGDSVFDETGEFVTTSPPSRASLEGQIKALAISSYGAGGSIDLTYDDNGNIRASIGMNAKVSGSVSGYPVFVPVGDNDGYFIGKWILEGWTNKTIKSSIPILRPNSYPISAMIAGWDLYAWDLYNFESPAGVYTGNQIDPRLSGMTEDNDLLYLAESMVGMANASKWGTVAVTALPVAGSGTWWYSPSGTFRGNFGDVIDCETRIGVIHYNLTPIPSVALW